MQFFISTFIIMLICIIALLQDKSYDSGVILPRSQNKVPNRKEDKLLKCNNSSRFTLDRSPQLLITEHKEQTEAFVELLTGRLINHSVVNPTMATTTKPNAFVHSNAEKDPGYRNTFCSQCNFCFITPAFGSYKQSFEEFPN